MQTLSYVIIGLFLLFAIMFLAKKKRITGYSKLRIEKLWQQVEDMPDNTASVLEADKVLHAVFKELGYKGSVGTCLKRHGKKLPNEQAVWDAHKLRNKVAHTPGFTVGDKEAARALQAFRRAVYSFL